MLSPCPAGALHRAQEAVAVRSTRNRYFSPLQLARACELAARARGLMDAAEAKQTESTAPGWKEFLPPPPPEGASGAETRDRAEDGSAEPTEVGAGDWLKRAKEAFEEAGAAEEVERLRAELGEE